MGKNSVESSLKRFLKRRVKITLRFVVAFMIMGTSVFADVITEPVISTKEGMLEELNDKNLNINISNWEEVDNRNNSINYGVAGVSKGVVNINSEDISIVTENTKNLHPDRKGNYSYGIIVQDSGKVKLGNKNTKKIDIITTSDYFGIGLYADKGNNTGGQIEVTADNVNIVVNGIGKDGDVYGIYSITRTTNAKEEDKSIVEIKAKDTNIIVNSEGGVSAGIASWSEGKVKINEGNVTIKAEDVIHARGNSVVEINKDNNLQNTVKLNGDIKFEYASNSGTDVNSDVIVNLSNSDSEFTGKVYTYLKSGTPTDDNLKYTGMKLGVSNGATWNVTGDSLVNNLILNGGVINILNTKETGNETNSGELGDYTGINDSQTVLNVDNLSGNGGTITFETEIDGNKVDVANGTLKIKNDVTDETNLKVGFSGIDSDELIGNNVNLQEAFKQLSNKVTDKNGNKIDEIEETYFAESGELHGEITAVEDGKGGFFINTEKDSDVVKGLRDLATINLLTWRQEMNSLNKRMGELRNSTGEHGVWTRVYTGKIENGERYDNDYQTYQVGYDKKYSVDNGVMFVGGLVSYSKGETNYELGTGENYSVGAGIYATWLSNDGYFADVVLKQSRLHNKFDVMNKGGKYKQSGDYNNWGTSLSGQYGKRFDVNDKLFIEPSAELTLGRVEDTTYTTSAGVNIHQDTMYSLVGNIGTAVGYKINEKGNIYTRVSLVREFQGDIDTYYEHNSATNETHEDLADTWVEFGIGANYRFAEDLNVYVDLQKTGEATVDTEWQANLGFRYEF